MKSENGSPIPSRENGRQEPFSHNPTVLHSQVRAQQKSSRTISPAPSSDAFLICPTNLRTDHLEGARKVVSHAPHSTTQPQWLPLKWSINRSLMDWACICNPLPPPHTHTKLPPPQPLHYFSCSTEQLRSSKNPSLYIPNSALPCITIGELFPLESME